jgi:hypothetical protein
VHSTDKAFDFRKGEFLSGDTFQVTENLAELMLVFALVSV